MKKLKLFVWEGKGVLTDYTDGMICVLAENIEQALKLINKKCDYCQSSFNASNYKIIKKPEAFLVWGGG
jgi:hypothetical protein